MPSTPPVCLGKFWCVGLGRRACAWLTLDQLHWAISVSAGPGLLAREVTNDGVLYTWGWGGSFLYGAGALGLGHRNSCALPQKVDFFEQRLVRIRIKTLNGAMCWLNHGVSAWQHVLLFWVFVGGQGFNSG